MEFIATLIIFFAAFMLLALGWIFRRKPLAGTCGGLNNFQGKSNCEICGAMSADPKFCQKAKKNDRN